MKNILLLILFYSSFVFSQSEIGKKSSKFSKFPIVAKPEFNNILKPLDLKPEKQNPFSSQETFENEAPLYVSNASIFSNKKEPSFVIGDNRTEVLNQPAFVNPNLDVLDKLNNKTPKPVSENFVALRGDKEFCDIKTDADYLYITFRDFGEVDGDKFKIIMNGKDITGQVTLQGYYQEMKIKLDNGFNKIDFEILNVGSVSPNTAEFLFSTSPDVIICQDNWALLTGFKAIVKIFKE